MTVSPIRRRVLLRIGVIAGGAVAAVCGLDQSARTYAYTGTPTAPDRAPALALTNDTGGHFDLSQHRGAVMLIYFGYAHCPDVCPTTLAMIQAALEQLGPKARRVRCVFVTLDPRRDTGPLLHRYLAQFPAGTTPAFVGLTGSPEAIAAAARAWGVTWRFVQDGAFIDHTSVVSVVGPGGRLRLRYGFSQLGDPHAVARDIDHLLHDG